MGLIVQGGMAPTVSGKVGNVVFARNRGGQYVRNFVKPVNPQTSRQSFVRGVFASLSSTWRSLTNVVQASFQVTGVNNPVPNRVGLTTQLAGLPQFQAINSPRLLAGLDPVLIPPADPLMRSWGQELFEAADNTDGTVEFSWDTSADWVAAEGALLVFVSPPQSTSVNFYKGVYGQQATALGAGAGTVGSLSLTPTIPVPTGATRRFFFRAYPTFPEGNLGTPQTGMVDVTNP